MPVRAVVYVGALLASALVSGWRSLAVLVAIIGGFEAFQYLGRKRGLPRWHNWPATRGIVDLVNVRREQVYFAELNYSYTVDGHRYAGFHQTGFDTEESAWTFCRTFEKCVVEVRYDPKEPQISLLAI